MNNFLIFYWQLFELRLILYDTLHAHSSKETSYQLNFFLMIQDNNSKGHVRSSINVLMNKYMAMNDSLVCTKGSLCGSGKARFGRHIHAVI